MDNAFAFDVGVSDWSCFHFKGQNELKILIDYNIQFKYTHVLY